VLATELRARLQRRALKQSVGSWVEGAAARAAAAALDLRVSSVGEWAWAQTRLRRALGRWCAVWPVQYIVLFQRFVS